VSASSRVAPAQLDVAGLRGNDAATQLSRALNSPDYLIR
tara:strand:- start:10403 stop:10519 length:117 start_codon:yes stop_codon:yes gene_type:complete